MSPATAAAVLAVAKLDVDLILAGCPPPPIATIKAVRK